MTKKKNKYIIIIILMVLSAQCSLIEVKNKFYSNDEYSLLEKTLNALDYGFGYDYQLEMNYIYSYSYSKDNADKKEKAFAEIINNADFKTVLGLYEKILKLNAITDYKLNRYKTESKWRFYTFIRSDLSEPLNNYSSLLSKYVLKKNPSLAEFFEMKKKSFEIEVADEYTLKEEIVDTF